jgi:bifunctional UDP-N-acetylglucosamine pyrophosphorylase/glucosamine-1-phosphate N-acetyltransferase
MAPLVTIILAAGKGTRMKSDLVKVLHPLLGVPMLSYPVDLSVTKLKAQKTIVVVGCQADRIKERFKGEPIEFVLQEEQLGTGHAVLQAIPLLQGFEGTVLILCGDVPLVRASTLRGFIESFERDEAVLSVLTTFVEDPSGYGRIIRDDKGLLQRIVEEKDATKEERTIREINTGLYCVRAPFLREGLQGIGRENAQGEYYLTDLIEIARGKGFSCSAFRAEDSLEVMGINTRVDLATAHERLRQEKVRELMLSGVTVLDPSTAYIDRGVTVGKDTVLHPNCTLQGKTVIGERCVIESGVKISDSILGDEVTIRPHCVITESRLEDGVVIGPFAHLRPLTEVRSKAKIGNFVEVKKSVIGRGTKANHLTYLGDAVIGEKVNIGAGTITCNYDGFKKHQTIIGDRVFVGSNVEIVAPVKVGNDSSIGAGSTITRDVPEGALAISRVKQKTIPGWSEKQKRRREKED